MYLGLRETRLTGEWRKLHNEELYALYCSPNVIRVIESRIMRWAGHVESIESGEMHAWF